MTNEIEIPKIEIVDLNTLKVDGKNPNRMSKEKRAALWDGMQKFGVIVPIITNKECTIADGQNRWEILLEHGITKGPVIKLPISDVDRRILRQVLNKLKGEHDLEKDIDEFNFLLENDSLKEFSKLMGQKEEDFKALLDSSPSIENKENSFMVTEKKCPKCGHEW